MMTQRKWMTGLTLVELMVALTIALVATMAATQLYMSTRQTYRIQTMQNRLAEDGRFAISMLQRIITQAGFRPAPTVPPPAAWAGPAITPAAPNSATQMHVRFVADQANQIDCSGNVVSTDAEVTDLVISGAAGRLVCAPSGTSLTGTCESGGLTCWLASSGAGTEMMDFLLEYGNDTGPPTVADFGCGSDVGGGLKAGDCIPDDYVLATAVANPQNIAAVRACLVLRSDTTDASIEKTAPYKDCLGSDIAGSQDDHKQYRTFRTTVLLRNR